MKTLTFLLTTLSLTTTTLAANGGRCSGQWNVDNCICVDAGICASFGGSPDPGQPGNYPCPWDPDNIQGCFVGGCGQGASACTWNCWGGTPLPGELCLFGRRKVLMGSIICR